LIAILSLLFILVLSLVLTRVATIALCHTGLPREAASFQARSAFTGVGFTTHESEKVVNHPVRRRILMSLMLLGNAGIVTAVSSLILTFVSLDGRPTDTTLKIVLLISGLAALWTLSASRWIDRRLSKVIAWALGRYTDLDVRDYDSLLQLDGDFRVTELYVRPEDWLANRTLADSELRSEGVNVLGVERAGGEYEGNPTARTRIHPGDNVILYGRTASLERLDKRRRGARGDRDHRRAIREQHRSEADAEPLRRPAAVS